MKNQNRTQFLKQLALLIFGAVFVSVLYAQLDIPTNINNAVQTIGKIVLTPNGQVPSATNPAVVTIDANASGSVSAVKVLGSMNISPDDSSSNTLSAIASSIIGKLNRLFGNQSLIVGYNNTGTTTAVSSVIFGENNSLSGTDSAILGGKDNKVNGNYSTAGGQNAQANHPYTWVWSDYLSSYDPAEFASEKSNTFLIRAFNGVGINTANPGATLDVNGSFKQGSSYRSVIQLPMKAVSDIDNGDGPGRWYVRLHPSNRTNLASVKITVQGKRHYSNIMGWLTAEYSYYSPGNGTISHNDFRVTSTQGSAYTNLRIGDLVVENGYISIPVWSSNSNPVEVIIEYSDFDIIKDTLTNTSWASNALPAQNFQSIQGNLHVGGNVGIGTTGPTYKLDVAGNVRVSAGDSSYAFFGPNSSWGAKLYVGATPDKSGTGIAQVIATDGNLHLDSATNKGIYMNYYKPGNINMVANGGNVSIGTTTSQSKLYVNGSIMTQAGYAQNAGMTQYDLAGRAIGASNSIYSYGSICVNNNGAECNQANGVVLGLVNTTAQTNIPTNGNVFFNNGSNVGIGTTSPGSKLHVAGNTQITDGTASADTNAYGTFGVTRVANTSNTLSYIAMTRQGNSVRAMGIDPNNGWRFGSPTATTQYITDADTYMTISNASNIGIGTTTPSSKLHVKGSQNNTINSANAVAKFLGNDVGVHMGSLAGSPNYGAWLQSMRESDNLAFDLSLQANGGNVGIGTTTPKVKLDVAGQTNIMGQTSNGTSHYQFDGGTYKTPSSHTPSLLVREDNTTAGMNGFKPALSLYNNDGSLDSTVGLAFVSREANGAGNSVDLAGIAAVKESVGTNNGWSQGGLQFFVKNYGPRVDALRIKSNGDVGIGTTSPSEKLDVNGNIKSPGLWTKGVGVFASGTNATSIGIRTKADGSYSTAMGTDTTASGSYSTAMGYLTTAKGSYSTAMGFNTYAKGDFSIAMGYGQGLNDSYGAIGSNSLSLGTNTRAIGTYSVAIGNSAYTNGYSAIAIGESSNAIGSSSVGIGQYVSSNGPSSVAMGYSSQANGNYSVVMGSYSQANGEGSTAIGRLNNARGTVSTAIGYNSTANGYGAVSMGAGSQANGQYSTTMGYRTATSGNFATVLGRDNIGLTNAIFEIGVGTDDPNGSSLPIKKNALTVLQNGALYADSEVNCNTAQQACEYSLNWISPNYPKYMPLTGPYTMNDVYVNGDTLSYSTPSIDAYSDFYASKLTMNGTPLTPFWDSNLFAYKVSQNINYAPDPWNGCNDSYPTYYWGGSTNFYGAQIFKLNKTVYGGYYCKYSVSSFIITIPGNGTYSKVADGKTFAFPAGFYSDNGDGSNYYINMYGGRPTYNGQIMRQPGENPIANELYNNGWVSPQLGACDTNVLGYYWDGNDMSASLYDNSLFESYPSSFLQVVGTPVSVDAPLRAPSFAISQFGDVGIGFSTTGYTQKGDYPLEVNGNFKTSGLIAKGTGVIVNGDNSTAMGKYNVGINGAALEVGNGTSTSARSNSLTILDNSNVGIGTTGPTNKLTIQAGHGDTQLSLRARNTGGDDADMMLWASEPGATYAGVGISNNVKNLNVGGGITFPRINTTRGGSYMRLLDNSINLSTIDSAGSAATPLVVGSNTVTVNGRLNASEISTPTLIVDKLVNRTVSNISVSGQLLPDTNAPTESQTIGSPTTGWKALYAGSINALSDGKVGIGTNSIDAGVKLQVAGTIKSTTRVQSPEYCDANGSNCFNSSSFVKPGGSQSTNYLTKWNGSPTIASSVVYDNGTNVGIGTTTVPYKLTVAGDIYANGGWLRTAGSAGWYNESYVGGWYMNDSNWIRNQSSEGLSLGSNQAGVSKLLALSNDAAGQEASTAIYMGYSSSSADPYGARILQTSNPSNTRSSDLSFQIHGTTAGDTDWKTALMIQRDTGNVGIGTTSPSESLDINGGIKLSNNIKIKKSTDGSSPFNSSYSMSNYSSALYLSVLDGDEGGIAIDNDGTTVYGASDGGYLFRTIDEDLYTGCSGGTPDEKRKCSTRFIVNDAGNVGIGTYTPLSKLHVEATSSAAMRFTRAGANIYGFEIGGTSFGLYDYTNSAYKWNVIGNDLLLNQSAGNVGIGTTTPSSKLHVKGLQNNTINSANAVAKFLGNDVGVHMGSLAGSPNYGAWLQSMRESDNLAFDLSLQPNGGNVGIGTTSPTAGYKLDVYGPMMVGAAAATYNGGLALDRSYPIHGSIWVDSDGGNLLSSIGYYGHKWETSAGEAMRINQDRSVTLQSNITAPNFLGNATTATNLSTNRTNWNNNGTISAVVGQLSWKNYGNGHTIFDASQGISPSGTAIDKSNSEYAWSSSYPTLMGWNGGNTFGVRVDSARYADEAYYAEEAGYAYTLQGLSASQFVQGTTNSFFVGGNASTYYPIQFRDNKWDDGMFELEINRPNVHLDGSSYGALISKFTCHPTQRGHGADFCRSEIYDSAGPFIADFKYNPNSTDFIVWLRGGRTYYYKSKNNGISLISSSTADKVFNYGQYGTYTYSSRSTIDSKAVAGGQYFDKNVTVGGNILAAGFYYSSDITLKKDIKPLDNALNKINKLNGYSFTWKSTDKKDIGVIAQEVEKVFPDLVHTNDAGIKSVEYGNLVAPIIEAIKELSQKVEQLFAKYVDQEARINTLEQRLQKLEAHK